MILKQLRIFEPEGRVTIDAVKVHVIDQQNLLRHIRSYRNKGLNTPCVFVTEMFL